LLKLQRLAGNAAVTRIVQRAGGENTGGWTLSMRPKQPLDLNLDPETIRKVLNESEARWLEEEA
jgi:hypothetical protein